MLGQSLSELAGTSSCFSKHVPKGPPVRTRGLLGQWLIVAIHEADGQFCCAACAESSEATDARRLAPCTDNPMPCDRSLSYIHALSDARNEEQSVGVGADGSFWLLAWSYTVDIYIYREIHAESLTCNVRLCYSCIVLQAM